MSHGLPPETPALIASDVSLPTERIVRTRLDLIALAADKCTDGGPALILIGEAVGSRPKTSHVTRPGALHHVA